MKPGREMDVAVGREVMNRDGLGVLIPEYSTRADSALDVIEELRSRGFQVDIRRLDPYSQYEWLCWARGSAAVFDVDMGMPGRTMPIAVCRAALRAVGVHVEEAA